MNSTNTEGIVIFILMITAIFVELMYSRVVLNHYSFKKSILPCIGVIMFLFLFAGAILGTGVFFIEILHK